MVFDGRFDFRLGYVMICCDPYLNKCLFDCDGVLLLIKFNFSVAGWVCYERI